MSVAVQRASANPRPRRRPARYVLAAVIVDEVGVHLVGDDPETVGRGELGDPGELVEHLGAMLSGPHGPDGREEERLDILRRVPRERIERAPDRDDDVPAHSVELPEDAVAERVAGVLGWTVTTPLRGPLLRVLFRRGARSTSLMCTMKIFSGFTAPLRSWMR